MRADVHLHLNHQITTGQRYSVYIFVLLSPLSNVAGIAGPARADIRLHLNYQITTGQCFTIQQSMITRSQEELAGVFRQWGGDMCSTMDCMDVVPAVNCSTLTSTKMDIQLANVRWVKFSVLYCSLERGGGCFFCGFRNGREHFFQFLSVGEIFRFCFHLPNKEKKIHFVVFEAT